MSERSVHLKLESSEAHVLSAASRLLSAYISTGQLNDTNEDALAAKSVQLATKMALQIDAYVVSDDELDAERGAGSLQKPQVFQPPPLRR